MCLQYAQQLSDNLCYESDGCVTRQAASDRQVPRFASQDSPDSSCFEREA